MGTFLPLKNWYPIIGVMVVRFFTISLLILMCATISSLLLLRLRYRLRLGFCEIFFGMYGLAHLVF